MICKKQFIEIAALYDLFKKISEKRDKLDIYIKDNSEEEIMTYENQLEKLIVSKTIYKKTTMEILNIMKEYNFLESISVNKKYDIHLKNILNNYDLLGQVNLFAHTLNVAYEALQDNKLINIKSVNILLALLHDFGKNNKIRSEYNKTNKNLSHEKISAMFVEEFFANQIFNGNKEINSELVTILTQTIDVQHSLLTAQKNTFLYNLRKYDKLAREKELLLVKREMLSK